MTPPPRFQTSWGLAVVLALFFVATSLFNVLHPIWEAPDEPGHYEYLRYIAEHRRLPELIPAEDIGPAERHQVPLYYVIQAFLVGWVDDGTERLWHPNPFVTWPDHPMRTAIAVHRQEEAFPYTGYVLGVHLARLVSTLMAAGTVVVTYLTARRLLDDPRLALASAAVVAFTPGFAFESATVNNDNLVTLLSFATLLFSVSLLKRGTPTFRDGAVGGLLLAGAVLAKLSGLLLVPVLALTWLLALWRTGAEDWRRGVLSFLPLPVVFLPLAGWWALVKWQDLPGYLAGSGLGAGERSLLPPFDKLAANLDVQLPATIFRAYWGWFGWLSELCLPNWQYLAIFGICALSALGYARFVARGEWRQYPPATTRGLLLLAFCAAVFQYSLLARWLNQPAAGNNHGRFLYPSIVAISILLVLGLAHVSRHRSLVVGFTGSFLLLITLSVPFSVSQRMFAPPVDAWGLFDASGLQHSLDLSYANGITALGASAERWELRPGQELAFDFFWRSERRQEKDFWAAFRLQDPAGEVVVSDHAVPQAFGYSPRLWYAGEVVRDRRKILLPAGAVPGQYTLQLRLLDDWAARDIPLKDGSLANPGWVPVTVLRVRPTGPNTPAQRMAPASVFGRQIALLGYSLEDIGPSPRREACLTLFWRAERAVVEQYHVSVQALDEQGRLVAQHDGPPYDGRYPTTRWEVGEVVPDRHCLDFGHLPAGRYRLGVVLYRLADGSRLAIGDDDATLADLGSLDLD